MLFIFESWTLVCLSQTNGKLRQVSCFSLWPLHIVIEALELLLLLGGLCLLRLQSLSYSCKTAIDLSIALTFYHHHEWALHISFTEFRGKETTPVRDLLNLPLICEYPLYFLIPDLGNLQQKEGTSYPLVDLWTWFTSPISVLPQGVTVLAWDQIKGLSELLSCLELWIHFAQAH